MTLRRNVLLIHLGLAATFSTSAQTVSALSVPPSREEVTTLAAEQLVTMQQTVTTKVQGINTTTDGNGGWSVSFSPPFAAATPIIEPHPVTAAGQLPVVCRVTTRTAAGASGDCVQSTTTTIPGTLSAVLGMVIHPFGSKAANVPIMVIAREPTQ